MRGFFARMRAGMQRFMYGRYGSDELSVFLMGCSLVLMLLSVFRVLWFLYFVGAAVLVYSLFRSFSRNYAKRRRERDVYLRLRAKPRKFFALRRKIHSERKTQCYFKCKSCHAMLRVPRGKGTIDVTCPRCHKITVKKT